MYDTVIEPKVLFDHLGDSRWRTIDCRASLSDLDFGRNAHAAAHIPGAVFGDLATDFSGPLIRGFTGRHPLPDSTTLSTTLGRWGIAADTQVVAYDAGNGAFAARVWWLLRWLGHAPVAVLNGGLAAWQAEGYTVQAGIETAGARQFRIGPALTRTVSAQDILLRAAEIELLDARSQVRFRGEIEPIDPVAGHIPGARCLPFEGNLDARNRFLEHAALRARFAAVASSGRELVSYCGSGVTACHNILAIKLAGLPEPSLYPGSFSEWIQDPNRPVER
jgi:thiosulfate/3-mercaptopyruvate sulfurtransferase